jgi:serine protease Do
MKQITAFVLAGVAGGIVTLAGGKLLNSNNNSFNASGMPNAAQTVAYNGSPNGGAVPSNFNAASERSLPSVVHIFSQEEYQPRTERERQMMYLFGTPQPQQSTGSGVIINKEGYIVTNNHVIENANYVEVTLYDQRKVQAKVVGTDPSTDLAVIKIDAKDLRPIDFANSDDARIGDWVLAVGNPFSFANSVTAGIISAKGRDISIIQGQRAIESFIQTDAAVNPGNSGGALVNTDGKLVGINTAIYSPTGTYSGYSFAIPANLAKKVVYDIIQFGEVKRGKIGVNILAVDSKLVEEESLKVNEGVYVVGVEKGGGAEEGGLKEGDVIIAIDGGNVKNTSELQEKIGSRNLGDVIKVTIDRFGLRKELTMKLK